MLSSGLGMYVLQVEIPQGRTIFPNQRPFLLAKPHSYTALWDCLSWRGTNSKRKGNGWWSFLALISVYNYMAISMMVGLISVSTGRLSAPQGSVFSLYCMPGLKCHWINKNSCKGRCSSDLVPGGPQAALQGLLPHLLLEMALGEASAMLHPWAVLMMMKWRLTQFRQVSPAVRRSHTLKWTFLLLSFKKVKLFYFFTFQDFCLFGWMIFYFELFWDSLTM